MPVGDMERIRDELRALRDRRDHGFVSSAARRIGISRQHLSRFLDGGGVSHKTLEKIEQLLLDEKSENGATNVREAHTDYGSTPTAAISLARRLEALAEFLRNPRFDTRSKVIEFRASVTALHESLESIVAALDETDDVDD